jgi:hypothetical protein
LNRFPSRMYRRSTVIDLWPVVAAIMFLKAREALPR